MAAIKVTNYAVVFVALVCGQQCVSLSQGQSLPCVTNGQPCSDQLCPNTAVQLTCNVPNSKLGSTTQWMTSSPICTLELDQRGPFGCSGQTSTSPPCPPFTAVNANVTGPYLPCNTSTLSFVMSPNLNGTLITCATATVAGIIGSITLISVADPSAPPHLSITAELNGLEVKCFSGDQDTHCNVTIQMNGAVKSVTGNTTFNGLTSNMMYPISARAINRCGDYSETSASYWTLPEAPPTSTIRVLQSLINESATQLDISWSHIGGNVSHYKVKSISGMNIFTSQVSVQSYCVDLRCAYHQIVQTTGSHYTTTISSVNDGGEGPEGDPVQAQSKSSSNPSFSVRIGVGIGIGIPILICISAVLVVFGTSCYFMKKRSGHGRSEPSSTNGNDRVLDAENSTVNQQVEQKNKKHSQCGNEIQFTDTEDKSSVQIPCDLGAAKFKKIDNGNTPSIKSNKVVLASSVNTTEHSSKCDKSQNPQLNKVQEIRKPFHRMPHYIQTAHNGTVLTIQSDGVVFSTRNTIPDDKQLWHIDGQPDNSFIIASKMNRMVLACIGNEVSIQNRRGDDSQKWLQDRDTIVSLKHRTIMCAKDSDLENAYMYVLVCVKNTSEHGIHLCSLQASPMVPMCLVDEKNGCVLEISDDKVIDTSNMDVTNLSQHWYIYPDSKRDNMYTIVSGKGQKVLQLDDNGELIVKGSGFEEEAAQWTMDNGRIVVRNEWHTRNKRYNVYPMFRNCFIIRFLSYYVTWDFNTENVVLQDDVMYSMPFEMQLWMLDMQPDGTFTMTSSVNKKKCLSNKHNALVCSDFSYDDCQMWRREGKFIKSDKTDSYLGFYFPASDEHIDIVKPPIIHDVDDHSVAISEHEHATINILSPSLTISGGGTGNQKQLKCECATSKVVIQVSQILHQDTDFVLSTNIDDSELVFISPRNCLPSHITQFWVLDYQMDGTFLIISDAKQKLVLSCDYKISPSTQNQLVLTHFSRDESQLWRFDGGHIESVKFKDQVISLVPGIHTSLCLSTKSATDKAQLFRQESYTPVLIRHVMDDTVLELDDISELKFCVVDESWPDSQVWYLKYTNGFSDSSFMIISKKTGKALEEVEHLKVVSKDLDATNKHQHWKRDGLFIKSQNGLFIARDEKNMLTLYKNITSPKSRSFKFQHFVVGSYF